MSVLLNTSLADQAVINDAKAMNLSDEPVFASMLDLAEKSVALKKLIASKNMDAVELFALAREHRAVGQVPEYRAELDICALLLQIFQCESQLRQSLSRNCISWKIIDDRVDIYAPEEGVLELELAVENTTKLRKYPRELRQFTEIVRDSVLRSRKLVREINREDDANGKVDSISRPTSPIPGKSSYRSNVVELRSVEGLQLVITEINSIDLSELNIENRLEIEVALLDLSRREMNFSFHTVISTRCIKGSTGNIVVHDTDIEYAKSVHRKVIADVNFCKK
jgi:hypothetical protein